MDKEGLKRYKYLRVVIIDTMVGGRYFMPIKTTYLVIIMVVLIVISSLTGYYIGAQFAAAPSTITLTETKTVTKTITGTVTPPAFNWRQYEGATLRVLLKEGYETAAVKKFLSEFEELTGIRVELEIYDEPTTRKKFILDAAAKTGVYDVVAVQFWYFAEYYQAGWLEPLDEYIAERSPPNFYIDDFPEGILNLYRGNDGKIYVIPASASGGVLIYRVDILEKHNLTPPKTVKDVVELAKKLKELEPDLYPFIGRGTPDFASFGTSAGWAWPYGAKILEIIEPKKVKVTIDTPEMLEAMKDYVALMKDYGPPEAAAMSWDKMSEIYRAGKAVLNFEMSGFPWVYNNPDISGVAGKIDYVLIKGPADNYAQWLYSEGLAISKFSRNKGAAWLFIVWRCSYDMWIKEAEAGIRFDLPSINVYKDSRYWEAADRWGATDLAKKMSDVMASVDGRYWPWIPEFVEVAEAFQSKISAAIAGEISVEEALRRAQADVESILSGHGYEIVR
ncbi:MAG: sugar ABC transporter substrate-binding protein [Desulfurococcaceae archaeon]